MSDTALRASIVVIGDELLGGFVHDANAGFIAERLQANAVPLDRVHVVPDTFAAIDEALQLELGRARPRLVLTTGGIGSTPDDITYEAVAASLGLGTYLEPDIAALLERSIRWTEQQGLAVDDEGRAHFLRMARLPEGASLLPTTGWASAVRVDVDGGIDEADGATIVILPGVPSLTRSLVEEGVEPLLLVGRNEPWTVVELQHGFPESLLNPTFVRLAAAFPEVKLGSYPGDPMLVRLQGGAEEVAGAAALVQTDLDELSASEAGQRIAASWARRTARARDDAAVREDLDG